MNIALVATVILLSAVIAYTFTDPRPGEVCGEGYLSIPAQHGTVVCISKQVAFRVQP